jgi:hypothetical protein
MHLCAVFRKEKSTMAKSKKVILDTGKSVNPASIDGYLLASAGPKPASQTVRLTGDTVRRAAGDRDALLWDSELTGFGLRTRARAVARAGS